MAQNTKSHGKYICYQVMWPGHSQKGSSSSLGQLLYQIWMRKRERETMNHEKIAGILKWQQHNSQGWILNSVIQFGHICYALRWFMVDLHVSSQWVAFTWPSVFRGTGGRGWVIVSIKYKLHYCDVIMSPTTSQITSLTIVYSIFYSGTDQRKHQSSASLAFVRGIH